MSDIEEVRAAVSRLREVAEAATPSPWHVEPKSHPHYATNDVPQVRHDASSGDYTTAVAPMVWPGNAEYIAMMDPDLALVLADWLDAMWRSMVGSSKGDTPFEKQALAVARKVNR